MVTDIPAIRQKTPRKTIRRMVSHILHFGRRQPLAEASAVRGADGKNPVIKPTTIAKKEKTPGTYLTLIDIYVKNYDTIFLAFDPSPYSTRLLSSDFLDQVQKRYGETNEGEVEVRLSLPKKLRSSDTERLIRQRLREHYGKEAERFDKAILSLRKTGVRYALIGVAIYAFCANIPESIRLVDGALQAIDQIISAALKAVGRAVDIASLILAFFGGEMMLQSYGISLHPEIRQRENLYKKFRDANFIFVSVEDVVDKVEESTGAKTEKKKDQKESDGAGGGTGHPAAAPSGPATQPATDPGTTPPAAVPSFPALQHAPQPQPAH